MYFSILSPAHGYLDLNSCSCGLDFPDGLKTSIDIFFLFQAGLVQNYLPVFLASTRKSEPHSSKQRILPIDAPGEDLVAGLVLTINIGAVDACTHNT